MEKKPFAQCPRRDGRAAHGNSSAGADEVFVDKKRGEGDVAEAVTERQEKAPSPKERRASGAAAVSLALRLLGVGPLLILILLIAAISQLTPIF